MGRGSSKAGAAAGQLPRAANAVPSNNVPTNAVAMTDKMAQEMRDNEDSSYTANTKAAIKMYISNTDFDRDGHSLSQTMNYLLDNDVDFSTETAASINQKFGLNLSNNDVASMQYTYTRMNAAYHPLGNDTILQRGAHDDVLRNVFGISDYSKLSESQLKSQLVGQAFRNKSPMSTSYDINKNPFLGSGSGVSGGREIVYNIKAGKNTPALLGSKKQSEVILGHNNFRITDVRYTGKTATPRGRSFKPQLEISIETF